MRWIDDTSVQLFTRISFRFFAGYGFYNSGISGFFPYFLPLQYGTTIFCNLCFDSIYTAIYIYTINDTFFQCVIDYAIIVKECHCFRNWCGCQSNKSGRIKIFQYLTPIPINGAVTLIYDNQIKIIMWQIGVRRQYNFFCRLIIIIVVIILNSISFQKRKKTLYCRNNNIAIRWYRRGTKTVYCKYCIECISIFCQPKSSKFSLCLFPKVISVHKK